MDTHGLTPHCLPPSSTKLADSRTNPAYTTGYVPGDREEISYSFGEFSRLPDAIDVQRAADPFVFPDDEETRKAVGDVVFVAWCIETGAKFEPLAAEVVEVAAAAFAAHDEHGVAAWLRSGAVSSVGSA